MRARMRMPVDGKFIAFGLLVGIGFASGFGLSAEVSPRIRLSAPPPLAKGGGGGGGGGGQLNGANGGGGGGAVHGSGHATDTDVDSAEGGDGGGSAAAREADGGERRAGAGAGAAAAPCRSVDLMGTEAAAFLSGNTADGLTDAQVDPEMLYFAPRGWIGRMRASSIEVKAWSRQEGSFCDPNLRPRAAPSCGVLHARKCVDASRDGARLGELLRPSGRWIPVLRGRAGAFPAHLPFLDAPRSAAELTPVDDAPAGSRGGRAAFGAGTAYTRAGGPGGGPAAIVFYAPDGRRLSFPRPSGADLRRGLAIDVGWWTFARELLCQGEGASGENPSCFKPKPGRAGRLTLVSTSDRPGIDLLAVAEKEAAPDDD